MVSGRVSGLCQFIWSFGTHPETVSLMAVPRSKEATLRRAGKQSELWYNVV